MDQEQSLEFNIHPMFRRMITTAYDLGRGDEITEDHYYSMQSALMQLISPVAGDLVKAMVGEATSMEEWSKAASQLERFIYKLTGPIDKNEPMPAAVLREGVKTTEMKG